ncbi:glucosaminidase domain-containing protein [Alteromonas oceanisediminis]|uniref:glucosaminidase domain-containing protein n=1 Tax=Alteromonas oceanisediminis TaxID=2836180 RepID=UPI0020239BCC|nr:glucosaminidase domain-containing protein [Alteromonas oceanisediminis]
MTHNQDAKPIYQKKAVWIAAAIVAIAAILITSLWQKPNVLPDIPVAEIDDEVPDFSEFERVQDKKSAFFQYLLPVVEQQNEYILSLRLIVKSMFEEFKQTGELSPLQQERLAWLVEEYNIDQELPLAQQFEVLLMRVDIIPAELALVQAANESAWGTSRFARNGYNFYGLWCFKKGCGFVPKRRNDDAAHEVAKFDDLSRATYVYLRNLNRHPAYKHLREIRRTLRENQQEITAIALSEGLMRYSERGEDYIDELQHMIRINQEYIGV